MGRKAVIFSLVSGAVLAVFGLTALAQEAFDIHKAAYKGNMMCKLCHQGLEKHKPIVEAFDKTAHPKALQKASAEGAIVGDFSTNPLFKKEDVAWVLGKGRNKQAYLDAQFKVLGAMWYVKEKKWKKAQEADGLTQCIACHTTGFDPATKKWTQDGVTCEACHGPGGDHAKMGNKAFIVNPKNLVPAKTGMICGQCHSAGKDPTGKFVHPVGFRPGDDLAKVFVDAKPTVAGANQQYSEHLQSKHAQVGTHCTTCHSPHSNGATGKSQLKQPVNEQCLACHAGTIKDLKTHAPQAAADATCATCHMHEGVHTFKKATQ